MAPGVGDDPAAAGGGFAGPDGQDEGGRGHLLAGRDGEGGEAGRVEAGRLAALVVVVVVAVAVSRDGATALDNIDAWDEDGEDGEDDQGFGTPVAPALGPLESLAEGSRMWSFSGRDIIVIGSRRLFRFGGIFLSRLGRL